MRISIKINCYAVPGRASNRARRSSAERQMPSTSDQDRPDGAVIVRRASFGYGRTTVLHEVDIELHRGTITYLIGPNGSGKSTLLRAIAGLLSPTAGDVLVHGRPARDHRGATALVLQQTQTDPRVPISVRELVAMGRYPRLGLLRRHGATDRSAVESAMARLGIDDLADERVHDLSGGQRQRAVIAQVLAQDADVLLLDEPLTALDAPSRERIMTVLAQERSCGHTIAVSTHELAEAAQGDDVLLLAGRPVAFGPPGEVLIPDVLAEAYGGRVLRLDDGSFLLDDGAHHHEHHEPHRPHPRDHMR